MIEVKSLYRYPVKGLGPEKLSSARLTRDENFELDRHWALKTSQLEFDPDNPRFLPKRNFAQLYSEPDLARLRCNFEQESSVMTLTAPKGESIKADIATREGQSAISGFVSGFLGEGSFNRLEVVCAPNHHFSDIPAKAVSIINLASVRELSKLAGTNIDPLRFRANIYVDGIDPWAERGWVGKTLSVNATAVLQADEEIGRCKATHVNLENGLLDVSILDILRDNFNHTICGIYASTKPQTPFVLKPGDKLNLDK